MPKTDLELLDLMCDQEASRINDEFDACAEGETFYIIPCAYCPKGSFSVVNEDDLNANGHRSFIAWFKYNGQRNAQRLVDNLFDSWSEIYINDSLEWDHVAQGAAPELP